MKITLKSDNIFKPHGSNLENYKKYLLEQWEELPPVFVTSSESGLGRDEVLDYIESLNKCL